MKVTIHNESIIVINVYASNKSVSSYKEQKLLETYRNIDKYIVVEYLNTTLS